MTEPAPPAVASAQAEFDALFWRLILRLEGRVALVVIGSASVVLAFLLWARFAGAPMGVAGAEIAAGFGGFYVVEAVLLQAGGYRGWMRYLATLMDVTLPSVLVLLDWAEQG